MRTHEQTTDEILDLAAAQFKVPRENLSRLGEELAESRLRMMREGDYVYRPQPRGALPERYVF